LKLERQRIASFLKSPEKSFRACLIYGPDRGLVAERAQTLACAIVPDTQDAFRVIHLSPDALGANAARIGDEAAQLSLTGGRRLIWIKEAGDAAGSPLAAFLKSPPPGDAFVLVEAGDLKPRSALRRAFEGSPNAACIACYLDGPREIEALVREVLGARKVSADAAAVQYLTSSLGGDRMMSRMELEKLALYAGEGGRIGFDDAASVVGDSAELSVDDVVLGAAEGDTPGFERALHRALSEGEAPVRILRAAMRHFERLHRAGAKMAAGASEEEAIAALRPPLFFKVKERFKRQLRLWPPKRAAAVLGALTETEIKVKSAGMPAETLTRAALLRIARGALGAKARA
jgi:DNA polymerase-3 subunit delta